MLKNTISGKLKIPSDHYELLYNEKVLNDDATLSYLDIRSESILFLIITKTKDSNPEPISIKVMISEKDSIELDVKNTDTVKHVRDLTSEKCGIKPYSLDLFYRGQKLDNEKALFDCEITNGSIIMGILRVSGC